MIRYLLLLKNDIRSQNVGAGCACCYLLFLLLALSADRVKKCVCVYTNSSIYTCLSNGNPLQCSCLENPRDGGAWWAAVYGVAQSRTQLKRLSSSSSSYCKWLMHITFIFYYFIQWSHASSIFDSTLRSDDVFNKYLKRNLGWFWNNFIENLISTSF